MQTRRLTITRSCQAARAGRQADGDDRRQQLRRQADSDREREQGRLEDRAAERDVDHEDRARQHHGHDREQPRERLQPLLERGLPLPLAQAQRDRAERGRGPVRTTSPRPSPPRTSVPMNAHERQIE